MNKPKIQVPPTIPANKPSPVPANFPQHPPTRPMPTPPNPNPPGGAPHAPAPSNPAGPMKPPLPPNMAGGMPPSGPGPGGMMIHGHAAPPRPAPDSMVTIQIPRSQFELMKTMVTNLATILHMGSQKADADIQAQAHGAVGAPGGQNPAIAALTGMSPGGGNGMPPGPVPPVPAGGMAGAPPSQNPAIAALAQKIGVGGPQGQ